MSVMRIAGQVASALLVLTACRGQAAPAPAERPTPAPAGTGSTSLTLAYQARGRIWTQVPGRAAADAAPAVPTDNQHLAWSPDGEQIAFESGFEKIWTVAGDGTGERERYSCHGSCASAFEPSWSPDGTTLAFINIVGDRIHTLSSQLMFLDLESGSTRVVHEDASGVVWDFTPRWAADGTRIVMEHDTFASHLLDEERVLSRHLQVVDIDTGRAAIIPRTAGAQGPDWSPNDDRIVYSDGTDLFLIRPDGTHRQRLTHMTGGRQAAIQPTFLPDGSGVVFTWVKGVLEGGSETTIPGVLDLATGVISAVPDASGATHVRARPGSTPVNLIHDASAEGATPETNGGKVQVKGWTVPASDQFTAVAYGTFGGFPDQTSAGPPHRGKNFFAGGTDDRSATGTQVVAVTDYEELISAGDAQFTLSGWLGGFSGHRDRARLSVTWRDATGQAVGKVTKIGPVTVADRDGQTVMLPRRRTGSVPPAARSVLITLHMRRDDGAYNDGYADKLSLVITPK